MNRLHRQNPTMIGFKFFHLSPLNVTSVFIVVVCRLWGGIHWHCNERKVWGQEVPGIVHQVSWEKQLLLFTNGICTQKNATPLTNICWNICNVCFYLFYFFTGRGDEVIAAASLNYDPAVSAVAERLVSGKVITKKEAEYVKSVLCFDWWSFWSIFLLRQQ